MGFWDSLSDFWFGPGRSAAQGVMNGTNGQIATSTPANSYEGMLRDMATGKGPSLAADQYNRANQSGIAAQVAMSRGRGMGAARTAAEQGGQMAQGLAAGSSEARTREQMGAIGAGSGLEQQRAQMDMQRQMANQQAYMQALGMVNQQGGIGQSLAGLAAQGLGAYAMLRGPKSGGGAPAASMSAMGMPDLVNPNAWPGMNGTAAPQQGGGGGGGWLDDWYRNNGSF